MTGVARCRRVGTAQYEMRIAIVIERRFFPARFVVTALALIAVAATMHVVDRVT